MAEDDHEGADRRSRILSGALDAFLRFGFKRSSLGDIATAAGVSRTALYHYISSKEDVLRAVVDDLHASTWRQAEIALVDASTLEEALLGLFEAKLGRLFGAMTASPHGIELVDASHRLTGAATKAADTAFRTLVATTLSRHSRAEDADEVADTLLSAAKGLMREGDEYVAKPVFEARLRRLIAWAVYDVSTY